MIVGHQVISRIIRGIDNARNILAGIHGLGYNEAGISWDKPGEYSVIVYTGTDAADTEQARLDMELITGEPAEVHLWRMD